jgi:hypothetical protein
MKRLKEVFREGSGYRAFFLSMASNVYVQDIADSADEVRAAIKTNRKEVSAP